MNYYQEYKNLKPWLGLIVALIFWSASVIFFIVGMSFDTELFFMGKNIIMPVSVALALSITIIQIAGNGDDSMERIDRVVWLASYALGIGTNVYGLSVVLNMNSPSLEWVVAVSLGIIIEITPERQLIRFLKGLKKPQVPRPEKSKYQPKHKPAHMGKPNHNRPSLTPASSLMRNEPAYHPIGMSAQVRGDAKSGFKAEDYRNMMRGEG